MIIGVSSSGFSRARDFERPADAASHDPAGMRIRPSLTVAHVAAFATILAPPQIGRRIFRSNWNTRPNLQNNQRARLAD